MTVPSNIIKTSHKRISDKMQTSQTHLISGITKDITQHLYIGLRREEDVFSGLPDDFTGDDFQWTDGTPVCVIFYSYLIFLNIIFAD